MNDIKRTAAMTTDAAIGGEYCYVLSMTMNATNDVCGIAKDMIRGDGEIMIWSVMSMTDAATRLVVERVIDIINGAFDG